MNKRNDYLADRELVFMEHEPVGREKDRHYAIRILSLRVDKNGRDDFATAPVRHFSHFVLSHIYSGRGRLWLKDRGEYRLEAGSAVLICPGDINLYGGLPGGDYQEDFLIFDGDSVRHMLALGLLETGRVEFGASRRLLELVPLLQDPSPESAWQAGLLVQQWLLEIYRVKRKKTRISRMGMLLREIREQPAHWWTLAEMAKYCRLSEAQFRRNFVHLTGMSPKNYVEGIKLREGAKRLSGTSSSIDEICRELGYRDRFHFSRRFKKLFDVAPGTYRTRSRMSRKR